MKIWSLVFALVATLQSLASEPTLIGEWPEVRRGSVMRFKIAGDKAYAASNDLLIIDVSNPTSLTVIGSVDIGAPIRVKDVEVRGSYAYATAENGLHVIDISIPTAPRVVGKYLIESAGDRIVLEGSRAYVADGAAGIRIYDISNPTSPTLLGAISAPWTGHRLAVRGNILFNGWGRIDAFDVTDPASPVWLGAMNTSLINGLTISGNYLYAAADTAGIQIFDITDPANLVEVARFPNDRNAEEVSIEGNLAALADRGAGVVMVDVSNPRAPVRLGTYEATGNLTSTTYQAILQNGFVYATVFKVLDVANPSAPTLVGSLQLPPRIVTSGMALNSNTAFLAESDGVKAIDISNPSSPTQVGVYRAGESIRRVEVKDRTLYVVPSLGGLDIVNVADPASMVRVQAWAETGNFFVQVEGNRGFFMRDGLIEIVDLTNPQAPVLLGTYPTANIARGAEVVGNLAYVTGGSRSIEILDIQNPAAPNRIGGVATSRSTDRVEVRGNYAYVIAAFDFLTFDITNPIAPQQISLVTWTGGLFDMEVHGDRTLVTHENYEHDEIIVVDVSSPSAPRTLGKIAMYETSFPSTVRFQNGRIYAAHGGLKIFEPGALAAPALNVRLTPAPAFWLSGLAGSRYVLEHSTDLEGSPWTPLPEVTLAASPQAVAVPENARFVRARLVEQ